MSTGVRRTKNVRCRGAPVANDEMCRLWKPLQCMLVVSYLLANRGILYGYLSSALLSAYPHAMLKVRTLGMTDGTLGMT